MRPPTSDAYARSRGEGVVEFDAGHPVSLSLIEEVVVKFPFAAVEFDTSGSVNDLAQVEAAKEVVSKLMMLVLAHGWNNDMPAARHLYESD